MAAYFLVVLQRGPAFIKELLSVIPNAHYYKRGTYELKKVMFPFIIRNWVLQVLCCMLLLKYVQFLMQIIEYANNKEFTSIIVVHTNRREPG
jgi:ribosome production factor 1